MSVFRVLPFFFAALTVSGASNFTWVVRGESSIELRHDQEEILLSFQFDPELADPHFDILRRVGGENLVWVGPEDHPWHYGHWFSWKLINEVNFWETNRRTGRGEGLTEVTKPVIKITDQSAKISYNRYYRTTTDQEPVLKDEFTLELHAPKSADCSFGPAIDWAIKTTALASVTLDRTPLPSEPGGKDWGGYAGLSWRGSKQLGQVEFGDSEGRKGMAIQRQRAQWVNAVGFLGEKRVGVAVVASSDAADNDSYWYIVSREEIPFWFINPGVLIAEPITMEEGTSFHHEYRLVAHDGSWLPSSE
jgi:hypothetical protein